MRNNKFSESALYSRCERVLQGSSLPKIPKYGNYRGADKQIPSLVTSGSVETFKHQSIQYTGTAMIGIATMHKSNSVPVFSTQEAKDISAMRRS